MRDAIAHEHGFSDWAAVAAHRDQPVDPHFEAAVAITYGYPAAVDALARSGARVDNLVFAAAVGDLPMVRHYLQGQGADRPGSAARVGARGPALDPGRLLEYALIYSAGLGRSAAVELLLAQGADLTVTEPVWHATAAGLARYHHRHHILALLEAT